MFAPRLIHPVIAEIFRLDPAATRAFDPPGEPDSGYDDTFKEFVAYDQSGERRESRKELAPIEVRAQVEQESFETLVATFGADSPVTDTVLILHTRDLRKKGLILSDGSLDIPKGSRVSRLMHPQTRDQLEPTFVDEFLFEARPRSWGYRGRTNIYVLYFYRRERLGEL